jgi:lipid A ethanolaminephosphotransferase
MQHLQVPGLCNSRECFDEVLLHKLSEKIAALPSASSQLIVLHQKGSHGPDYYDRYPQDKEFFEPVCKTNQLQHCSRQEVVNGFDNTIRYTDFFLNSTIEWLKAQQGRYNTALLYLSDHGESLGEDGLYLHGMPYALAPAAQKQVPMFMWLPPEFAQANKIDTQCLATSSMSEFSQDNLFHTLLGLLNIDTGVYDSQWDITHPCRY